MKVTIVGAGNVGATCADVLAYKEVSNEIVLVDIKEGLSEGKSLDIFQKSPILVLCRGLSYEIALFGLQDEASLATFKHQSHFQPLRSLGGGSSHFHRLP